MRRKNATNIPNLYVLGVLLAVSVVLAGCNGTKPPGPLGDVKLVFFPKPPDIPRVQFLWSFHSTKDFGAERSGLADFVAGTDENIYKTITKPYGIAVKGGRIFVADTFSPKVAVIDVTKRSFTTFGTEGAGTLRKPINVRLGPTGERLYVTDMLRQQIIVFDLDGNYLTEYGTGKEFKPADVLVTEDELYVLDNDKEVHNIKVYDLKTRKLKRTLGGQGMEPGKFLYPSSFVMDKEKYIYVCDLLNYRVQKIDRTGKVLSIFGQQGDTPGTFAIPKSLVVDPDGIVYVVDARLHIAQLFNTKGQHLMFIGGGGEKDGEMYLPAQITISHDIEPFRELIAPDFTAKYLLFVTNQFGPNKINVYAFGIGPKPTAPPTSQPTTQPTSQPTTQPK